MNPMIGLRRSCAILSVLAFGSLLFILMNIIREPFAKMNQSKNVSDFASQDMSSPIGASQTRSQLTNDIGTQAQIISLDAKPVSLNLGVNTWRKSFDAKQSEFNRRYKPPNLENKYPNKPTLSGDFNDEGPLASNSQL